jgi:hypothetical protein
MFELNLYPTLKKCKDDTKRSLMHIEKNNPALRLGTRFGFDNKISKQQGHHKNWIIKG